MSDTEPVGVSEDDSDDLAQKAAGYLAMFTQLGESVASELADTRLPSPDVVFDGGHELDLGGRTVRLRPTARAHSRGAQVVTVPEAGVPFTGDLAEAGQFAIFPWFPPHDTDVSGIGWIRVMAELAAEQHRVVVPGHGAIGEASLLAEVRDYLRELRDETWRRRDSAVSEETVIEEVRALMIERHPRVADAGVDRARGRVPVRRACGRRRRRRACGRRERRRACGRRG